MPLKVQINVSILYCDTLRLLFCTHCVCGHDDVTLLARCCLTNSTRQIICLISKVAASMWKPEFLPERFRDTHTHTAHTSVLLWLLSGNSFCTWKHQRGGICFFSLQINRWCVSPSAGYLLFRWEMVFGSLTLAQQMAPGRHLNLCL